jgi:predicted ABC-type ATPase
LRQLHLAIGPNGSGKTTFVTEFLALELPNYPYVNADEIAKARWPDNPEAHAYDAAQVAADTRAYLIASGKSFVAETVFSHPSKLDLIRLAQEAEYQVVLHVMLVPEELTVRRIEYRVRAGGHNVPEHKIRERFHRVWPLAPEAILMADGAAVYDNSRPTGPSIVAEFVHGSPTGHVRWPEWAPEPLSSLSP